MEEQVVSPSARGAASRVLYVGPDSRRRRGIEALRESDLSVEVVEAQRHEQALERLDDDSIDCLITVQELPDGTGIDLCERTASVAPGVPTVLVVTDGSEETAASAIDAGVDGYVRESAESVPERLPEQVRTVLRSEPAGSSDVLQRFRGLQEASRDLAAADSVAQICEIAITVMRETVGLPLSGIHLRSDDRLEPVAISSAVEETFGRPPTYTPDDEFVWSAYERGEAERFERVDEAEGIDADATPIESGMVLPLGEHGVHLVTSTEQRTFSETERFFAESIASTTAVALDRANATEQLRTERDRLARLFESVPDSVVEYRFEDGRPVFEAVNDAFEDVFGYEAATVHGQSVDDLLVPEDERANAREINERAAAGERVQQEVERLTDDGRRAFLLRNAPWSDGQGGYALYVDISDRKERERTIAALHGATRTLMRADSVESIGEAVVETARDIVGLPYASVFQYEDETGYLEAVAVSEACLDTLGPPPEFAPGEGIVGWAFERGERVVLDDAQEDDRALESGSDAVRSYCVLPLGTHGVLTISAPTVGEFDDATVEMAEILASNATVALDRLERERELESRGETLRRQNERLEAFASVVSHDLRNPLAVLSGSLDLAEATGESEHFEDARDAIDRMEALIDDLLVLAQQGRTVSDVLPVGVQGVAEDAWAEVPTEEATLTVEGEFVARADPDRLRQLFANLFRNAVEHGRTTDGPPTVEVGVLDDRDGFYVADDGPGIPEDHRGQVFEHGFTTSSEGTGLGLKIVADIADAHGWNVRATESRWGGTRIEISGAEDASYDQARNGA